MSEGSIETGPRLLVLSSLFPSEVQPRAGLFIRERMFRVARHCPMVVVAPQPWFPLQSVIRLWRPHFRPTAPRFEVMEGVEVHRPRFLCFPGVLKRADGLFMALGSYRTVRKLVRHHALNMLDVHFGYPDGAAGRLLASWLRLPMVLTLRGKEADQARSTLAAPLREAILAADEVITVSSALRDVATGLGADARRVNFIGNGVDLEKFTPLPQGEARRKLGLVQDAEMLISVGHLVERKGFHRTIACLPALLADHPRLHYVIVGDANQYGDMLAALRRQVAELGLQDRVHFLGGMAPEDLRVPLSAADVFVLDTSYEGWANVFLEAMACGLPVVTTRVGGNAEVIDSPSLGALVEFGDQQAMTAALDRALRKDWNRKQIRLHAQANAWDQRIPTVVKLLRRVLQRRKAAEAEKKTLASHSQTPEVTAHQKVAANQHGGSPGDAMRPDVRQRTG